MYCRKSTVCRRVRTTSSMSWGRSEYAPFAGMMVAERSSSLRMKSAMSCVRLLMIKTWLRLSNDFNTLSMVTVSTYSNSPPMRIFSISTTTKDAKRITTLI